MLIDLSQTWPWVTASKHKGTQTVITRPSLSQAWCDGRVRPFASDEERLKGNRHTPFPATNLDGGRLQTLVEPGEFEQSYEVLSWSLDLDVSVIYCIDVFPSYGPRGGLIVKVSTPFIADSLKAHPPIWHDVWFPSEEGWRARTVFDALISGGDL